MSVKARNKGLKMTSINRRTAPPAYRDRERVARLRAYVMEAIRDQIGAAE